MNIIPLNALCKKKVLYLKLNLQNFQPVPQFFTNNKSYGFVRSKLTIYTIDKIRYLSLVKKLTV